VGLKPPFITPESSRAGKNNRAFLLHDSRCMSAPISTLALPANVCTRTRTRIACAPSSSNRVLFPHSASVTVASANLERPGEESVNNASTASAPLPAVGYRRVASECSALPNNCTAVWVREDLRFSEVISHPCARQIGRHMVAFDIHDAEFSSMVVA